MNYEKQYYKIVKPLIKEGIVREVYRSDVISILNIAESFYLICYIEMEHVGGLIANAKMIRLVAKGDENFGILISKLEEKNQVAAIELDKDSIKKMRKLKIKTMAEGPSKIIDYEIEKELANKMKDRPKPFKWI